MTVSIAAGLSDADVAARADRAVARFLRLTAANPGR